MGLVTPEKIRTLPNKLYAKAKQDRRHKVASRATRQFPSSKVFGELGVQKTTVDASWQLRGPGMNLRRRAGCGKSARPVR